MKRMKVLFVTNHFRFSNGVASVLRSMIDNLDQTIFDIHLLAIYEFNEEFARPIRDKITVVKGFGFYFHGFDKLVNMIPLNLLYKYFVRDKYDLEVAYQFGIPTRILSVSPNPNKICWMHGYDVNHVLWSCYKKYNAIINVSRSGMERLVNDGMNESLCQYCYNIIDENIIIDKSHEIVSISKQKAITFVMVGRLSKEKGGPRLLECFNALKHYDAELWIVGGGANEDQMRQLLAEYQLQDSVKMVGAQTNPYKYINLADVYVCGSYSEGFSTACQEAAILGKPVITTEVSGAQELIDEAEAGCVVKNTKEGIVNGLKGVLENADLLAQWKAMAERNKTKFYKKERIKKIEKVLLENVNGPFARV